MGPVSCIQDGLHCLSWNNLLMLCASMAGVIPHFKKVITQLMAGMTNALKSSAETVTSARMEVGGGAGDCLPGCSGGSLRNLLEAGEVRS